MTAMIEAPAAVLKSIWRNRVMTGTTMIPPPSPRSEPAAPATKETASISRNCRKKVDMRVI